MLTKMIQVLYSFTNLVSIFFHYQITVLMDSLQTKQPEKMHIPSTSSVLAINKLVSYFLIVKLAAGSLLRYYWLYYFINKFIQDQ
jgi:hypothetical protein